MKQFLLYLLFIIRIYPLSANTIFDVTFDVDLQVIGTAELADGAITADKLGDMSAADGETIKWDSILNAWVPSPDIGSSGGGGTVTQVNRGAGLVSSGTAITLNGTLAVDVGTTANKIIQLDSSGDFLLPNHLSFASTGKVIFTHTTPQNFSLLNDSDFEIYDETGTQALLTLTPAGVLSAAGQYVCLQDGTNCPANLTTAGTITSLVAGTGLTGGAASGDTTLNVDVGTTANKIVQMTAATKLPAVNASQLTNLPYQGDITSVVAGTGILVSNSTSDVTISVDVGTSALQIVRLDGSARIPAVDGSQLTNLPPQGDITSIVAGTGLTGSSSSGATTLAVDVGTTANKIVQLTAATKLPAVDASQLLNIGASSLTGLGGGAAPHPAAGAGCPSGYIAVPGDAVYGTSSFCIMKYEAKYDSTGPASAAAGLPARYQISMENALGMCQGLGPGYALPNMAEWMTVNANIAQQSSSWSGGSLGSGCLYGGHNDNNPATPLAASTDDTQGWYGTNDSSLDLFECPFNTTVDSSDGKEQRRTFTLSNGQTIWDVSGNVWEYFDYLAIEIKMGTTIAFTEISLYTTANNNAYTTVDQIRPLNSVQNWWNDSWNSNQGTGRYYPGADGSGGAGLRGCGFAEGAPAGIYCLTLYLSPSTVSSHYGFRCVYRPASGGP